MLEVCGRSDVAGWVVRLQMDSLGVKSGAKFEAAVTLVVDFAKASARVCVTEECSLGILHVSAGSG